MNLFAHETEQETKRETGASSPPAAYSVSEINRKARGLIESNLPAVAVEGEISGLKQYPSGHWYFSLKDASAQLRCAMFRQNNRLLRFRPADGDRVAARGRLTIYEARGEFQLRVETLEKSGDGELHRAFELLKARLQAEGLFHRDLKKPVDTRFRHVGVVTSPSGAALRDILSVFRRRFPAMGVTLIPTAVQGDAAPAEICRAIETANALRARLGIEALIVGRGGGSPEDLKAFNEESVARAIFASELPIVSAVGHETDYSIADLVADERAPTPSAAAEMLSPSQQEYMQRLASMRVKLNNRARHGVQARRERLRLISRRLRDPTRRLQDHAQTLDELARRMARAQGNLLTGKRHALHAGRTALAHCSPARRVAALQAEGQALLRRLEQSMRARRERGAAALAQLRRALHSTSPLGILARGYSITTDDSAKVIRSVDEVSKGSRIITRLADGRLQSLVVERETEPESSTQS